MIPKKIAVLVWLMLLCWGYSFGQSSLAYQVSSKITNTQIKNKLRKKKKSFYENIRKQLIVMDSLNFISPSDTVFFLETYDFEIGTSYGMVWNKHKSISYEYFKDKITFTDRSVFDDMIIDLVGRWNVEKLKIYGEKSTLVNPFFIYASRAIVEKNKINVDCIAFNEFFFLNKPN